MALKKVAPTTQWPTQRRGAAPAELNLVHSGDAYLSLPGSSGNYASTPDSAALTVTDLDVRVEYAGPWSTVAAEALIKQYGGAGARSWDFEMDGDGTCTIYLSTDGTAATGYASTAAVPFSDWSLGWIRCTVDVDDGSGNHVVKFYTSSDGSTWTQLGTTITTAGTISLFDSSADVVVGPMNAAGYVYRAQVYDGIDGTLVADMDPSDQPNGTTSFEGSTGETWTVNQSGDPQAETTGQTYVLDDSATRDAVITQDGSTLVINDDTSLSRRKIVRVRGASTAILD